MANAVTTTHRESGDIAIVVGGASGIGEAAAVRLAAGGASVAIADVHLAKAEAVAGRIAAAGGKALAQRLDVTVEGEVDEAIAAVVDRLGTPTILVNSAAVPQNQPILELPLEAWQRVLSINLTGVFLCAQRTARHMVRAGYGRIVNISSVNGQRAIAGRGAYSAAKAGVEMLTKLMATELGASGVTVNAVAPGPVETLLVKAMHTAEIRRSWARVLPNPRYAEPEEVAAAVAFLCSKEAGYVNGHTLTIDGGFVGSGMFER